MSLRQSPLLSNHTTPNRSLVVRDGVEVPACFTSLSEEVQSLRTSVALSDMSHVSCLRLVGDDAYDVLDAVCPLDLYLRDGQIRHTLLLSDAGTPISDLYICNDDESFILLSEGMPTAELHSHITAYIEPGCDAAIENLGDTHTLLSLNGPFAWELMAKWLGPEVIGFPYLSFYRPGPDRIFFRAGNTGEYGYNFLVPHADAAAVWEELSTLGAAFDLAWAGQDALAHCGMENFFFNIWEEGEIATRMGLTPIELQLQWRISSNKEYPGSAAIQARRQKGPQHRVIGIVSEEPLLVGATIQCGDKQVGEILRSCPPLTIPRTCGLALVSLPWAYSGITDFSVGDKPIETVSTPFVNNLSLSIKTQQHNYLERHLIPAPTHRW